MIEYVIIPKKEFDDRIRSFDDLIAEDKMQPLDRSALQVYNSLLDKAVPLDTLLRTTCHSLNVEDVFEEEVLKEFPDADNDKSEPTEKERKIASAALSAMRRIGVGQSEAARRSMLIEFIKGYLEVGDDEVDESYIEDFLIHGSSAK